MYFDDPKLKLDAVSRYEEDLRVRREALRFTVALIVGIVVFAALTAWYYAR